ncbi:MAG TPA: ABC transporter permease [Actinomycetota bacterium]|nr:ABC transporter permease [Actinomycetota bacterium]
MSVAVAQYGALSRRAIVTTFRQPRYFVPSLLFPLMFMALSSAAFQRTTNLPGFPETDSFLQFLVSTTIIQGALFSSISAGAAMATDIEDGFFERLVASPVARTSIIAGRVMSSVLFGFLQAWLYFGVAMLFGMRPAGGPLGLLGVTVVAAIFSGGVGSIASSFAIRTGSSEAVQGAFPLLFSLMFLSSGFFPRNLMHGWFKTAAGINPLSHMIEGLRYQVITAFDARELAGALGIAGGFFLLGVVMSLLALRRRLRAAA